VSQQKQERSPFKRNNVRKVNEVMPLDIPRYVSDTISLDSTLSGAYLHALMYQWSVGMLPNDANECSRIMRLYGQSATDQASFILKRFFVQQEDGRWMNLRNRAIRGEVETQAKRYSDRGRKANEVRWSGHTAKWPKKSPTGILKRDGNFDEGVLMESSRHPQAHPQAVPVVLELGENLSPSLRSGGRAAAPLDRPRKSSGPADRGAKAAFSTSGKAKTKQNRPEKAQDVPEGSRTGNRAMQGEKRAGRPNSSRNLGEKKGMPDPEKQNRTTDPRFGSFRKEYFAFWKALHPNGINPPWGPLDGAALNVLFKRAPGLTVAQFTQMLSNRVDSEANPSQPAREWLADVVKYAHGPLNRFGEPKRK
jgi:uncharacterized protein YdaU (DUF1376 family)